jgi:hypothetical protein
MDSASAPTIMSIPFIPSKKAVAMRVMKGSLASPPIGLQLVAHIGRHYFALYSLQTRSRHLLVCLTATAGFPLSRE